MVYDFGDEKMTWQDARDFLGFAAYPFYWVYGAWWMGRNFFRAGRRAFRLFMRVHLVVVPVAW
jgi:hypothetical protein